MIWVEDQREDGFVLIHDVPEHWTKVRLETFLFGADNDEGLLDLDDFIEWHIYHTTPTVWSIRVWPPEEE